MSQQTGTFVKTYSDFITECSSGRSEEIQCMREKLIMRGGMASR